MVPRLGSAERWCDGWGLYRDFHACFGGQMVSSDQKYVGGCVAKAVRVILFI